MQPVALELAKERAPNACVVAGDAHRLPLESEHFDLVFCLDLLEHLENPEQAAAELLRILKPGGCLISTVPAWQALYGSHDRALMHHRRYSRKGFRVLLQDAGFAIDRLSFYNTTLFFPIAAVRAGRKLMRLDRGGDKDRGGSGDLKPLPRPINRVLESILGGERFWLRKMNLPIGVSLIAAAHRPQQ
jgi:SAM-dependent methyltransferase